MYGLGPYHPPSPPDTLQNMYPHKSFGSMRHGLPYTNHSRESSRTLDRERGRSRWLVVVKPEEPVADALAKSGLPDPTGLLVMLQQTMTLQLLSLLSHFSLPSPSGLFLRIRLPDDTSVRITEEAWPALFASHLAMEPAILPIAATLTLCVDHSRARWFKGWVVNPRAGLEGSLAGAKVSERLAMQEIRTELSQPTAQVSSADAYAKVAEWQQSSTSLAAPPPGGLVEESIPLETDFATTTSPYNPADYTYSISSLGPPSPLPSAPLSYKHFTPLTPDIGRRNQGSVCLTPSTATSWGPTTGDWDATSPARLSSVDLGERAASPGDEGRGLQQRAMSIESSREDIARDGSRGISEVTRETSSKQALDDQMTRESARQVSLEQPNIKDSLNQATLLQQATIAGRASASSRRRASPPLEIMVPVLRKVAAIQVSDPVFMAPAPSARFEDVDLSSGRPGAALCPVDVSDSWTGSHKSKGWASDAIEITAGSDILVSEDAMDLEAPLASSSALHTLGVRYRESAPSPEPTGVSNPFNFPITPDSGRRRASISSTVSGGSETSAPKRPVKTVLRAVGNFSEGAELEKPLNSLLSRKALTQSLGYPHIEIYPAVKGPRYIAPSSRYSVVYAPVKSSPSSASPKPIRCLLAPPLPWPRFEIYPRRTIAAVPGATVNVLLSSPKEWPCLEVLPPVRRREGPQSRPALPIGKTVKVLMIPPLPWTRLVIYPAMTHKPESIPIMLPGSRAYPWLEIYPTTSKTTRGLLAVMLPGSTAYPRFSLYPPVRKGQPSPVQIALSGSSAYPSLVIYPHSTTAVTDRVHAIAGSASLKPVQVNLAAPLPYPILEIYPVSRQAGSPVQRSAVLEEPVSIPPLKSTPLRFRPPPFSSSPVGTDSDDESTTRRTPVRNSVIGLSIRGRLSASPQPGAVSGTAVLPGARSRSGTLISEGAAFFSRPESNGSPPKTTGRLDKATLGRWV